MATQLECPNCGSTMREIVWGYGTIADVADAGDVVIGGCVIDVDPDGRVAALQCPACGTRADADGAALERPEPTATEHPFAVAFSNPQPAKQEAPMSDHERNDGGAAVRAAMDASPFVDEDFGGVASGADWRDHVEPYASREDALPEHGHPTPDHVQPYASREDALPAGSTPTPERVGPYASRDDRLPERSGGWRDRIDPYAS